MDKKKQSKIERIIEDNAKKRANYHPSPAVQAKLAEYGDLFEADRQRRDASDVRRYFNERTLEQYLDDCQKDVNGYVKPRADTEDWQVRYSNLLTRNKLLAILARLASARMKMKFEGQYGIEDWKRLRIFNALYEHMEDIDNGDMQQFMFMWDAWANGTVVDWIKPIQQTRQIKEITDLDQDTFQHTAKKSIIRQWRVGSHNIPLQDVWFGDLRQRDIQQQPRIWLRFMPDYQDFWDDYSRLPNAKYVPRTTGSKDDDNTFYRQDNQIENRVEVLWYMNVWEDRLIIWANRVELYDGPLPYGDEQTGKYYPVAVGVSEPIASNFVYGKSGADKLRYDKQMIDLFFRKLADRIILQSEPPVFAEGNEDLPETIRLKPGHITPVDSLEGIREVALQDTTNSIFNVLQFFKNEAEQISVSSASQGVAQPNRTATADTIAEQSVKQLVGLFQLFIEDFMVKRAKIKSSLLLQGLFNPETAKINLDDPEAEPEMHYAEFTEDNVMIEEWGTRGSYVYKIVGSPEELPSEEVIVMHELEAKRHNRTVKYIYLTPDYFDGLLPKIKPVVGSSMEQSSALKKAVETEFQRGFAAFFPEIYMQNQLEFAKDYITVYEKDFDRLLSVNPAQAQMGMAGGQTQPGMGGQPNPAMTGVDQTLKNIANV